MIRPATEADIDALCVIGARYVDMFPSENVSFSRDTFAEYLRNLIAQQVVNEDVALLVSECSGAVVAVFAGIVIPFPIIGQKVAVKLSWGTLPQYGVQGVALLRAAEKWARSRGATRLAASVFGEKAIKLMGDLGYSPTEMIFEKAL